MRSLCFLLAFLFSILLARSETALVPRGSVWKYFSFGEANENWFRATFDDADWPSGPAQLGYGEGDEQTVVEETPALAATTIYYRRAFVMTNLSQIETLTLRLVADDGAVVYLNEREILRRNMPAGPVSFGTEALSNIETNENAFQQFGFASINLRPGSNWMCVEIHQHSAGRTDSSFDLELVANVPLLRPLISITKPADGTQVLSGDLRIETTSSDSAGRIIYVDFMTNGVFLARATNEPFSFLWTQPPSGGYLITARAVNDFFLSRESEPVHVFIGSQLSPKISRGPYLQSLSTTGLVMRWRTDWYSESVVRYGTNIAALEFALTNSAPLFEHEAVLSKLAPGTPYYYSIGTSTQAMTTGPSFYFRTAPTNARPVRFWVVGDSGTADDYAGSVRDAYYAYNGSANADFFLMLGDNAYGGGSDYEYQKAVFDMYPELLRNTVVWPAIGNHDAEDDTGPDGNQAAPYLNIFDLPRNGQCGGVPSGSESYYSFDYGNIHVVCLDSFLSDRSTNGPMLTWLAQDLAATDKDWIIAFWHHPPYSWGGHNSDGNEYFLSEMRERALPLLESYGVDLVLCGHSHSYERSRFLNGHYGPSWALQPGMVLDGSLGNPASGGPYRKPSGGLGANRGTVYVVCGCSGEGGSGEGFPLHPAMALNHGGFGSMVIDVNGLQLTARFLRPSQAVEDIFTIDKTVPASLRPRLGIAQSTNGTVLSWPTSNPFYSLETSEAVDGHPWEAVNSLPQTFGRRKSLTLPARDTAGFYRLRSDP